VVISCAKYDVIAISPWTTRRNAHVAHVLVDARVRVSREGSELHDANACLIFAETDVSRMCAARRSGARNLARTFLSDLRDSERSANLDRARRDHGIGEFVGLKQLGAVGRPAAARRSSSSCAITARTSCSSRSSGSI
jgi:hypothetical protein